MTAQFWRKEKKRSINWFIQQDNNPKKSSIYSIYNRMARKKKRLFKAVKSSTSTWFECYAGTLRELCINQKPTNISGQSCVVAITFYTCVSVRFFASSSLAAIKHWFCSLSSACCPYLVKTLWKCASKLLGKKPKTNRLKQYPC